MDLSDFIVEYNIIGIAIGSVIGFSLTNWTEELRKTVIQPSIIKRFGIGQMFGSVAAMTIEIVVIVVVMYFVYTYIISKIMKKSLEAKKRDRIMNIRWKKKLLKRIERIDDVNREKLRRGLLTV